MEITEMVVWQLFEKELIILTLRGVDFTMSFRLQDISTTVVLPMMVRLLWRFAYDDDFIAYL